MTFSEFLPVDLRTRAAQSVRQQLLETDLDSEAGLKRLHEVTSHAFDLTNSADVEEKLAGIALIDELIDLKTSIQETMLARFANIFRTLFQQQNQELVVLEAAAVSIGHLAQAGGALTVDFVSLQVQQCFEWLASENERRRLAGLFVLRQLVLRTPTLFNVHTDQFLILIWPAVSDSRSEIRHAAIEALQAVLGDISRRSIRWRHSCYSRLYEHVYRELSSKRTQLHVVHGSLMMLESLLAVADDFFTPHFATLCSVVMSWSQTSHPVIVRCILSQLPLLAKLNPSQFLSDVTMSSASVKLIMQQLPTQNRDVAFVSFGDLAVILGPQFSAHVDTMMPHLLETFSGVNPVKLLSASRKKKRFVASVWILFERVPLFLSLT